MDKINNPSHSDTRLFQGTAWYYARYRLPYPPELLNFISLAFALDGTGRLLDLGCGTGQLAIPLSTRFQEVVGVDVSHEMLEEARHQAAQAGADNITWLEMPAEAVSPALGEFKLVTLGSSFHWMDRDAVLQRCYDLLMPEGGVAILGMQSFWNSPEPWALAVVNLVRRWLGEARRAGDGVFPNHERFEETVARSPFQRVKQGELRFNHQWGVDAVIGHLYSTSYCHRTWLGERVDAFEGELRAALQEQMKQASTLSQDIVLDYIFAWKNN